LFTTLAIISVGGQTLDLTTVLLIGVLGFLGWRLFADRDRPDDPNDPDSRPSQDIEKIVQTLLLILERINTNGPKPTLFDTPAVPATPMTPDPQRPTVSLLNRLLPFILEDVLKQAEREAEDASTSTDEA
jgi:hypothetical protein